MDWEEKTMDPVEKVLIVSEIESGWKNSELIWKLASDEFPL